MIIYSFIRIVRKEQRSVGFLINKSWGSKIQKFRSISDRVALLKIEVDSLLKNTLTIIQVYAPTSYLEEAECDAFYTKLTSTTYAYQASNKNQIIIMGDFDSQIGKRSWGEENTIGNYTYGDRMKEGRN